jgi:para-nitrobenzyl esterase
LHTLHTWNRPWQETDRQLENTMSDYWVNFAKFGNPNAKGVPEWKSYDKKSGIVMEFGDKVQDRPALFKTEFDFLEKAQK